MKRMLIVMAGLLLLSCKDTNDSGGEPVVSQEDTLMAEDTSREPSGLDLNLDEANKLARLPLDCISVEYPNKLNQVLGDSTEIGGPKELHPAFYGCFDWHSSVHGHWTLVSLLKQFPELERAEEIREKLRASLSEENMTAEVAYFQREHSENYERTYGWAWLLKLAEELHTWNDPLARELEANMQPLTDLLVIKFKDFLPKLNYPIRVGEHTNTAFALAFAYDYAMETQEKELQEVIEKRSRNFYLNDDNCPLGWEPSGFDFLSPCLSEVDIMRRILPANAFHMWMEDFLPQLKGEDFSMEVGEVSDRSDGKLVHLDGLNFSRAWVLSGLVTQYPEEYGHLRSVAREHLEYSFPNLVGDTYEGGHWLGSFALYALQEYHSPE